MNNLPNEIIHTIDLYYTEPIKTDINQRNLDVRNSAVTKEEAIALAKLVYSYSPTTSLEIGLAGAASCIAIASARKKLGLNAKHIALDPYQEKYSGSVGLLAIAQAGLKDEVAWLPERSENFLNSAQTRTEKYDFIFVDGGHNIGQTVTDAFYADKSLNSGGIIAFHDGYLFSTAAAVRYLMLECSYSLISLPPDSTFKLLGRSLRYLPSLGIWYVKNVIPKMHRSIVALKKKQ